jgi:urea transporter
MLKAILGLSIIVVLLVVGPLATIWAANTLFPALAIPYAIETWFAVILLGAFFRTNVSIKK